VVENPSDGVWVLRTPQTDWSSEPFADLGLPGCARRVLMAIGPNGGWDKPTSQPLIPASEFTLGLIEAAPNQGTALHRHRTTEVLMPLTGQWTISWGESGEHEITLGPWEVVQIAPSTFRRFRNAGTQTAQLLGITGDSDGGGIEWAPAVRQALGA
jgi:quercetin dioxygenase-like cupin family protein